MEGLNFYDDYDFYYNDSERSSSDHHDDSYQDWEMGDDEWATLELIKYRLTHYLKLITTLQLCQFRFKYIVMYPGKCS